MASHTVGCALSHLSPVNHGEEEALWCPVTPMMSHSISAPKSLGWDPLDSYIKSSWESPWVGPSAQRREARPLRAMVHVRAPCLKLPGRKSIKAKAAFPGMEP